MRCKTNCYHVWNMYTLRIRNHPLRRVCRRRLLCKACKWKIQIILNKKYMTKYFENPPHFTLFSEKKIIRFFVSLVLIDIHIFSRLVFLSLGTGLHQTWNLLIHLIDLRIHNFFLAENLLAKRLQLFSLLLKIKSNQEPTVLNFWRHTSFRKWIFSSALPRSYKCFDILLIKGNGLSWNRTWFSHLLVKLGKQAYFRTA